MNCSCGNCIPRQLLCMGRGNSKRFVFSVMDQDGDEVDISGASEIVFSVSEGLRVSGNIYAGGNEYFRKTLSGGDVLIAGTGYQFIVDIEPEDTELVSFTDSYYDATITTSSGNVYTVKSGVFRIIPTNAGF